MKIYIPAVYSLLIVIYLTRTNTYVIKSNNNIIKKKSVLKVDNNRKHNNILKHSKLTAKDDNNQQEFINPVTEFLSLFITKKDNNKSSNSNIIDSIDWDKPKRKKTSLELLAKDLTNALTISEWFVTGKVDPSFFNDNFVFEDPDLKVNGIKDYAIGTNKIFNQDMSRAEIINAVVNTTVPNTITINWRLEGKVNIGPGLKIKPYLISTDFRISPDDGLIISSLDRFSIPGYDIILSAFFPFLSSFLSPPAPTIDLLKEMAVSEQIELLIDYCSKYKLFLNNYWSSNDKLDLKSADQMRDNIITVINRVVETRPMTNNPHENWGKDSITSDCPINGYWDVLFSTSSDANIKPDKTLGSVVITQLANSNTGEFKNVLDYPESNGMIKKIIITNKGYTGTEMDTYRMNLGFDKVSLYIRNTLLPNIITLPLPSLTFLKPYFDTVYNTDKIRIQVTNDKQYYVFIKSNKTYIE